MFVSFRQQSYYVVHSPTKEARSTWVILIVHRTPRMSRIHRMSRISPRISRKPRTLYIERYRLGKLRNTSKNRTAKLSSVMKVKPPRETLGILPRPSITCYRTSPKSSAGTLNPTALVSDSAVTKIMRVKVRSFSNLGPSICQTKH